MTNHYDHNDPDFLFYCEETDTSPTHANTTSYENIINIIQEPLDAQSIEDMVMELFR